MNWNLNLDFHFHVCPKCSQRHECEGRKEECLLDSNLCFFCDTEGNDQPDGFF